MRTDPRGSLWRRWDLHFHTPASYDYKNRSVTAQQLVDGLVGAGIEVVAVTDHHVVDPGIIRDMQTLAGDHLTVLPGIELRTQLGGKESIHCIGIFSEDSDIEDLWTKLQSLGISPADVNRKGNDRVFVRFEESCERIRELGGVVTVHAGRKSNSIEGLRSASVLKRAIKEDYAKRYLHALEIGNIADRVSYSEMVFPKIGKILPLLLCSDNHNIEKYTTKCFMWVKADPGFVGLRQLLNEPEHRVYLGELPPSISRVEQNATKYMTEISFERTNAAAESEQWFSGKVPLNHELVAVIGKKGSGKSAFADILALLGNTHASGHFSFLNKERFLAPKTMFGDMFRAKVVWRSGRKIPLVLAEPADPSAPELVKYIPQNYLETVCSELKESRETQFYSELMEVIFSHVATEDRLGMDTLPGVISYLTNEKEERIAQLLKELSEVNTTIVAMESQHTNEYRKSLESQRDQRLEELTAHRQAEPDQIKKPDQDPEAREIMRLVTAELTELQNMAKELEDELRSEREKLRQAALEIVAADKLLARIENLERLVASFYTESAEAGAVLDLDMRELVLINVNKQPIFDVKDKAKERRRTAGESLDADEKISLAARHRATLDKADEKRLQLDEPNRRYQNYLQHLAEWQKKNNEIEGSENVTNSVKGLQARLHAWESLPAQIEEQRRIRSALVADLFGVKEQLLANYRKLYAPVQNFINNHPVSVLSKEHGALEFFASMSVDGLADGLLGMIHQGRKGSFQGEQEGSERLQGLISAAEFSVEAGVQAFLTSVQEHLEHDKRDGGAKPVVLGDQLRDRVAPQDIYDFLFGLGYLKPRFELRWQGKSLGQLSPGERGTLLLVFYLLIDRRDIPLIIDQPEENLDNQTIASILVPAIKHAKAHRQIFLVTHNPNLAVVCDAEQVIHARLDKTDGNRVIYSSGAIENPAITQLIVDVLEGTKPAFDLRDAKYKILECAS